MNIITTVVTNISRLSYAMKVIYIGIAIWWLFIVLALIILPPSLPELAGFTPHLSFVISIVLLLLSIVSICVEKNKLQPCFLVLVILICSLISVFKSYQWGAFAHLALNKYQYEQIVHQIHNAKEGNIQRICGDICSANSDRSIIKFHYAHGFLSWYDIVYDPDGYYIKPVNSIEDRYRKDMYFIEARHLIGDWYLVHFGD